MKIGDFNVKVALKKDGEEDIMGNFGSGTRNDRRQTAITNKPIIINEHILQEKYIEKIDMEKSSWTNKKLPPFGGRRLSPQGLKFGVSPLRPSRSISLVLRRR